jgi:hypothetical protein
LYRSCSDSASYPTEDTGCDEQDCADDEQPEEALDHKTEYSEDQPDYEQRDDESHHGAAVPGSAVASNVAAVAALTIFNTRAAAPSDSPMERSSTLPVAHRARRMRRWPARRWPRSPSRVARLTPLKHHDNTTFRVDATDRLAAPRRHTGLVVPEPVATYNSDLLTVAEDRAYPNRRSVCSSVESTAVSSTARWRGRTCGGSVHSWRAGKCTPRGWGNPTGSSVTGSTT